MELKNPYETNYYKFYILIALAILIIAASAIPNLKLGIDLTGGTAMTTKVNDATSSNQLKNFILDKGISDVTVKLTENPLSGEKGVVIEYTGHRDILQARELISSDPEQARSLVSKFVPPGSANLTVNEYVETAELNFRESLKQDIANQVGVKPNQISVSSVGASIGSVFWETSQRALILAFVLISAIVFILFRQLVPSIAVIQAIFFNVIVALAGMTILGIPMTLPTIVALLMIIGYSIDSDIMLVDKIIRRSTGTTAERAFSALKTGLTMTGTTLTVLLVLLFFSNFSQMTTLFQITGVLFFGLLGDLPSTYMVNAVIVKWWQDKQESS